MVQRSYRQLFTLKRSGVHARAHTCTQTHARMHRGARGTRDACTVMNVVLIKRSLDVVWTPPREDIERNWIGCISLWHSGAARVQWRENNGVGRTCFPFKR